MEQLRLLLIEDDESDIETCFDIVADFNEECHDVEIKVINGKTLDEALSLLDNSFDGAIIDMDLGNNTAEGNEVISRIQQHSWRIPIIIRTGRRSSAKESSNVLKVITRDAMTYDEIFKIFYNIYKTGLTKIMGGRGFIEDKLQLIFSQYLLPHTEIWVDYEKNAPNKTEKALLRYTLNHLLQLLDNDETKCFPIEFYNHSLTPYQISTGMIVKSKDQESYFVVLTPSCDLVKREEGKCKTGRCLLIEVDLWNTVFPDIDDITKCSKNKRKEIEKYLNNKKNYYYHNLPKTNTFIGGFLNFRKLQSVQSVDIDTSKGNFKSLDIQISPMFLKNIISRFSSYYARQGQPDIDTKLL